MAMWGSWGVQEDCGVLTRDYVGIQFEKLRDGVYTKNLQLSLVLVHETSSWRAQAWQVLAQVYVLSKFV